jgi:hypothetical protein
LVAEFIDTVTVIKKFIDVLEEVFCCYCHDNLPEMRMLSRANCFNLSETCT